MSYTKIIIGVFFICFLTNNRLYSQNKEKLKKEKQKIEKEIALTNQLLKETKKNTQVSLNQLVLINKQIKQREDLIVNINSEINYINNNIASNNKSVEILKKDLSELKEQYAKMIYYAYVNRNANNKLMFIFASKDFNQAYMRLKYMQQYSQYRKKQGEQILATQHKLSQKILELEGLLGEKKDLLSSQNKEKIKLDDQRQLKSQTVSSLQKKEQELVRTLKEKEEAARKLQKTIESIIAEEIKKASARAKESNPTAKTFTLTPEEQALSKSFALNKQKLPWPLLRGVITSNFGENPHPVIPGIKINNKGIDIATSTSSKARSVFDGTVVRIIEMPVYRHVVIISHGEYYSVYSKLDNVYVKQGDKIKTKQDIGVVHTNAEESKTELHFEIWKGDIFLDPAQWLAK